MSDSAGVTKTCSLCGVDVTLIPRTKDKAGRYYCTPCYDRAAAEQRQARDQRQVRAMPELANREPYLEPPPRLNPASAGHPCSSCGQPIAPNDFICTRCGYNPRTGQSMHTAVSAEKPPPTGFLAAVLWPVYLYFRPDTFFRMFGRLEIPGLHTFYALIVGFAAAADRYDSRMAVSQLGGTSTTIQDNWGFFWGVVAVSGLISSLLYVYIGGWWYRMRLRFSGDKTAEPKAVRHLYILSWLPFAVPMLIDKALDTMRYTRPSESHNAPFNVMDGLIIACLVWSIWIGFRGVRTLFDTRPVRAAVWFLVLPLLFYAVIFLGAMVAAALLMMNGSPPPAVAMPSTLSSQTWRFDHPANWFIDDTHPDHNPDNFIVVSPIQDAVFIADLQERATATAEEYVEEKLGMLRLNYGFVQPEAPLTSWGAFTGVGHVLRIQEGPDVYAGRVFAAEAGAERVLIILEMWPTAETKLLAPGFDLIERSFAIHP